MDLSPQLHDAILFEGEGGGYYAWTGAKCPELVAAKLGAGQLTLQPRSFALPHYADCSKIGYVIQGTCTVGWITPNSGEEKVLIINKGDAIPVPMGSISWWFNRGDTDMSIVFLGETKQSHTPGLFDYYFLTGALGLLKSFSSEFISEIYQIDEAESQTLANSETNALIITLDDDIDMPNNSDSDTDKYVFPLTGRVTGADYPMVDQIGLSPEFVGLEPNSVFGPFYTTDGSYQLIYVVNGTGNVEIVGLQGKKMLDVKLEQGQLIVVPKFFLAAFIAGENGMELYSVTTSARPVVQKFSGILSAWKAIPSSVLQAALHVSAENAKSLK